MKRFSKYIFCFGQMLFTVFVGVILLQLSCKKREYNNPVDTDVQLKSPKKLRMVHFKETNIRLEWKNENNFRAFPNTKPYFEIERSTNGRNFSFFAKVKAESLQATFTTENFNDTTYYFRLRVKAGNNASGYSNIISNTLSFPAPTNLTITESSEHNVHLRWSDNNDFESIFSIEQSTDAIHFTEVVTAPRDTHQIGIAGNYFADSTYYFRIRAKSNINTSEYSNIDSTAFDFPAPNNLRIISFGETFIEVRWEDNSSFETGFTLEQSSDNVFFAPVALFKPDSTHGMYFEKFLADSNYYFRLRATTDINVSGYSNSDSIAFQFNAPTELVVLVFNEEELRLQWNDQTYFETGFEVEQSLDSGNTYALVAQVPANEAGAIISGPFYWRYNYYFRVRAVGEINSSPYSTAVPVYFEFLRPTNLRVDSLSETQVTLSWHDNTLNEIAFDIQMSRDSGHYNTLFSTIANVTISTVSAIFVPGVKYYFRVQARSLYNTSDFSNVVSKSPFVAPPKNVAVTDVTESTMILVWEDSTSNELGFDIEESEDSMNFFMVDTVGANKTTDTVHGIFLTTQTYYFRVRARSLHGYSAYSNIAVGKFIFNAPSNMQLLVVTSNSEIVQWTDNSNSETGFEIEEGVNDSDFSWVKTVGANIRSAMILGTFVDDSIYYFRVRAVTENNASPYSNIINT